MEARLIKSLFSRISVSQRTKPRNMPQRAVSLFSLDRLPFSLFFCSFVFAVRPQSPSFRESVQHCESRAQCATL